MATAALRVAVITPYCHEDEATLRHCHRSVAEQDIAADHVMIADGRPLAVVEGWGVRHVVLPQAHGDNGNTPRGLGGLLARAEGYDFVAYLDADNWFHPGHLRALLALQAESGSAVCTSFRTFHDAAGASLAVQDADEDALRHVDTSCFLLARAAFDVLDVWLRMPRVLAPLCDRVFLAALLHRGHAIRSTGQRTVAFRSRYAGHYRAAGVPVPEDAKDAAAFKPARDFLASPQGVTECVAALGFWPPSYVELL